MHPRITRGIDRAEVDTSLIRLATSRSWSRHALTTERMMKRVIGSTTVYEGWSQPYLRGHQLKVIAVLKGRAHADADVDDENAYVTTDEHLARVGGVTADDRVEVVPFIEKEGRWSWASSDPRAVDLAAFKHLKTTD